MKKGTIRPADKVVIFNTGAAQKYAEVVEEELPRIDITRPMDWANI